MPDYTLILKTFGNHRKMSSDEEAMLKMLRELTEPQRAMLVEILGPPAKAAKHATKKLKRCDVCGISKRAAHHRDVDHPDYHKFDSGVPKVTGKPSKRPPLAEKIAGAAAQASAIVGNVETERCAYEGNGDGPCLELADNNIHHLNTVEGYHGFQPAPPVTAATGD